MRRHILCLRPPRCALQMCKPVGDADSERPNARHAISSDRASKGTMAWAGLNRGALLFIWHVVMRPEATGARATCDVKE